jgi:hypothetical protein
VSASDPLQLTLTAPQGGSFTIAESDWPQRPALPAGASMDWLGPQFTVTSSQFQTVAITMLADTDALPPAPTRGANPLWRPHPEALCNSPQGAIPGFCVTSQADLTHFCTITSSLTDCTGWDRRLGTPALGGGGVQVSMQVGIGGAATDFAAGYPSWSCGPNAADSIIVDSRSFDHHRRREIGPAAMAQGPRRPRRAQRSRHAARGELERHRDAQGAALTAAEGLAARATAALDAGPRPPCLRECGRPGARARSAAPAR